MATDPICGMYVEERTAELKFARDNRTYYFCSSSCLEQFAAPEAQSAALRRRLLVAWPLAAVVAVLTWLQPFAAWPYVAFVLASVVQFYPGLWFYRGFWDAVRSRVANMDVLIAVGTTVAYLYSAASLWAPSRVAPAYYFDASSLIVTLILSGNYLEHLTRHRSASAVRKLSELLPTSARVVRDARESEVSLAEVRPGDRVRIRPGDRFPVDGVVEVGRSAVNEALVTGESLPVEKAPGDEVVAGTVNGEGALEVRTTRVGGDTFLAEVGRLLTEAETSQVPIQRLADRIAERFVPLVLSLAIAAAAVWAIAGVGPTVALLVFVSVAITACPCAFGIATPAALAVGAGRAAEDGVLFRGRDSMERAARIDLVLTDKTGTLTRAEPELSDLVPAPGVDPNRLLALAAGIEAQSEHPLADAVRRAAAARSVVPLPVAEVAAEPGRGVRGTIDGVPVAVRSATTGAGLEGAGLRREAERLEGDGRTWSVVYEGGRSIGLLGFFDPVRPGVREGVARLARLGVRVVMVTGDNASAARAAARDAGIHEVHARMSPAQKLELLARYQQQGRAVAYVGDGINDAPALAAADLGIAIGTGTDVAREAGRVLLLRPEFGGVASALALGRRTVAKVRQNLVWALGYNAILLPVAAGALVPVFGVGVFAVLPITGALAMGLSSTTVVLNSLSLRRSPEATGRPIRPVTTPA